MEDWQNEFLDERLNDYVSDLRNEYSEYRPLWFRDRSPGTYDKRNISVENDDSIDSHALEVVKGAIASLTHEQHIALEFDLQLRTVGRVPDQEARLDEARRSIWAALVTRVVVIEGAA